jgi:hypothetical protein
MVNCWIVRPAIEDAEKEAMLDIEGQHWIILERDDAEETSNEDYEADDESLQFFEQAQIDKEVYVYHKSPRYSVYRILAKVYRLLPDGSTKREEAQVMLLNELLAGDDADFYDLMFWSDERRHAAVEWAQSLLAKQGWEFESISDQGPIDWLSVDEEMKELCEYAEEAEECVIFSTEDWKDKRAHRERRLHFEDVASQESLGSRRLFAGGEVAFYNPFADEEELLTELNMSPGDCPAADGYWRIHDDVILVQIHSMEVSERAPGVYVGMSEGDPPFVCLLAVVEGNAVATTDLEWAAKKFLEAKVDRSRLRCELQPLRGE